MKEVFTPSDLKEENNLFYMVDSARGIFVFDGYGKNMNEIEMKGIQKIQKIKENIIYVQEGKVYSLDLVSTNIAEIKTGAHKEVIRQAAILGGVLVTAGRTEVQFKRIQ